MDQNIEAPRLRSKEEQEFWDKVFLVALGNPTRGFAYTEGAAQQAQGIANYAVTLRRELAYAGKCGAEFGIDAFICTRRAGHTGHCKNY